MSSMGPFAPPPGSSQAPDGGYGAYAPPAAHQHAPQQPTSWAPTAYDPRWSPPNQQWPVSVHQPARAAAKPGVAGVVAMLSGVLGVLLLGVAVMNLQQAHGLAENAHLPEFIRRAAWDANMQRVVAFGGGSLVLGLAALAAGASSRASSGGRAGLGLGVVIVLGGLFVQVGRVQSGYSAMPAARDPLALELDAKPVFDAPIPTAPTIDPDVLEASLAAERLAASNAAPSSTSQPAPRAAEGDPAKVASDPSKAQAAPGKNAAGSADKSAIGRVLRSRSGQYRQCYEQALSKNPKLQGRVSVQLVIAPSGSVSSISAGGDMPSSVSNCVVKAMRTLTFPAQEGTVPVSYPLVFTPAS